MPHYLLSVYQPDGPGPAPDDLDRIMADVDAIDRDMKSAGVWVFAGGLHAPEGATVLRPRDGEVAATPGPFGAGGQHLGGFTIVDVADRGAALEWGRRLAAATTLPIEVRAFQGEG